MKKMMKKIAGYLPFIVGILALVAFVPPAGGCLLALAMAPGQAGGAVLPGDMGGGGGSVTTGAGHKATSGDGTTTPYFYNETATTAQANAVATTGAADLLSDQFLLNAYDQTWKLFPFDRPLISILYHPKFRGKTVNRDIVDNWIAGYPDGTTAVKTAISSGVTQATLNTDDNALIAQDMTIAVAPTSTLYGYYDDATATTAATADPGSPLLLYVTRIDGNDMPVVIPLNGAQTTKSARKTIPAAIPVGSKLTVFGTAVTEIQSQTANHITFPTRKQQYLQKFMTQVRISKSYLEAPSLAEYSFDDMTELAVFNELRNRNKSLWANPAATRQQVRNWKNEQPDELFTTEGLVHQIGKRFVADTGATSYATTNFTEDKLCEMFAFIGDGAAASQERFLFCGSNFLAKLQLLQLNKMRRVDGKVRLFDLTFSGISSDDLTLFAIREPTFKDIGWENRAVVLDLNYVRKYSRGRKVLTCDDEKTQTSETITRVIEERMGVVAIHPDAHCVIDLFPA